MIPPLPVLRTKPQSMPPQPPKTALLPQTSMLRPVLLPSEPMLQPKLPKTMRLQKQHLLLPMLLSALQPLKMRPMPPAVFPAFRPYFRMPLSLM